MEKLRTFGEIRIIPETIGEAGLERDVSICPEVVQGVLDNTDLSVTDPFHVHFVIEKFIERIHVSVDVIGSVHTLCSRCLAPMTQDVNLHLNSDYLSAASDMQGNLEAQRQARETGYYRKEIQLGEYIVSELVLSLPIIYLCSQDCKGLCSNCGTSLNEGPCACSQQWDPRFQKLAALKNNIRR
ncbi:MAG TPA: DUF177 domain-containing protein [Deltaproteobacteria bacterium]|nr:DUF177 domain-containing protein [Deltaproteobacteria bacterium]